MAQETLEETIARLSDQKRILREALSRACTQMTEDWLNIEGEFGSCFAKPEDAEREVEALRQARIVLSITED